MGRTYVFEWFSKSASYCELSSRCQICRVKERNIKNRSITISDAANMSGISDTSVQSILQHMPGHSRES